MAEYNFVRSDGSIISAEYSQAEVMSDVVIQKEITDAFCQYGNNAECLRIDNFPEVYNVKIKDKGIELYICAKGTTPGGRESIKDEQRVQQKSKYINYAYKQLEAGNVALQFGLYNYDGTLIFCAWKVKKSTASPETPVSKQIKISTIAKAMMDGFAQQEKSGGELVCAFRKEFIYFYVKNCTWLHDAKVENLSQYDKPIEEKENNSDEYLSPNWFSKMAQLYSSADIEAEQIYKDFKEKYGPEALKAVSGLDLLHKMFINETRDKENLCYVLEFDKQYSPFGGIGGGSAYKYGLYYSLDKQSWMTGAGRSPKALSQSEAIELGTNIREELLKGVEVIESIGDFSKLSAYVELNSKLHDVMPTILNKKWVMKYFHMLFPQVFPPFYNYDWQTKVLDTIDSEPDESAFVRMGQIALFVKQCGISALAFSKVIYNLDSLDPVNEDSVSAVTEVYTFASEIGNGKNVVVYGTPGCGKSYYVQNKLLAQFGVVNDEQHRIRTTFYQDYTNTDFVGQIIPKVKEDKSVTYEFNPGPFALALKMAIKYPNEAVSLIIEELNRGNAASIFGDIFQLLDRNEKGQSQYKITNVNLQDYLNDQFKEQNVCFDYIVIPSNLYIVATMNTSDQNVFTLDTAFKRRWKFEKLPNVFANDHEYAKYFVPGMEKVTWEELVNKINRFIVSRADELSSEDKQLGVYFIGKDSLCENLDEVTNENKKREFAYKLLEYLWDDVAKYSHSDWFDPEIKTLDQLITEYMKNGQKVFVNGIFE